MVTWAKGFRDTTRLHWHNVYKFQPKFRIFTELGSYVIKTAETVEELVESFKLRHEVFFREFQNLDQTGLDFDRFDWNFDHLLIVHQPTQKIIGTYRVSLLENIRHSYTALEFNMSGIFNSVEGPFLELGRACIRKDHRRGIVLSLLWRGIIEYMNQSKANVLFGCSSLKINHPREAALVYKYLIEQKSVIQNNFAAPTRQFQMNHFDAWFAYFDTGLSQTQREEAEKIIPPLLKSYLKFGAKVASEPAFDQDFDCVDMLTVLKKEEILDSLAQRLQVVR